METIEVIAAAHQQKLEEFADAGIEFTGSLNILDDTGHSRMQWSESDPAQVAAARARFDELKAKRYLAYKVDANGGQAEVIDKFDPSVERIIMQQQMVGG
jgi:hypothetical protein